MSKKDTGSDPGITAEQTVVIKALSASLVPQSYWPKKEPKAFVRIIADGQTQQSRIATRTINPHWDESFTLVVPSTSALELQVWKSHHVLPDRMIGASTIPVTKLRTSGKEVTLKLVAPDPTETGGTIYFTVSFPTLSNFQQASEALHHAKHDFATMENTTPPFTIKKTSTNASPATGKDITQNLARLIHALDKFAGLGAAISEVSPYAKAAWGIFSFVLKVAKAQLDLDASLNDLLETMANMLAFVHEADAIEKFNQLQYTVSAMIKQVNECAKFIHSYTRTTGFAKRAIGNLFSDTDERIAEFLKSFQSLRQNFDTYVNTSTAKIVTYMDSKLSDLYDQALLNTLRIAPDGSNSRLGCLEGTRVSVIDDVVRWVYSPVDAKNPNRPLLLTGVAGAGKTAVANSLATLFRDGGVLGAAFFFDRADAERNSARPVISTLARALAAYDSSFGKQICAALEKDPGLATTLDLYRQFKHLILGPANYISQNYKIVLILDALDECRDIGPLLEILSSEWCQISQWFCLILTARPQPSIMKVLGKAVLQWRLLSTGELVLKDIQVYVTNRLTMISQYGEVPEGWPVEKELQELVDMSKGLFIWVKTACDLIDSSVSPSHRLLDILQRKEVLAGSIDKLYLVALEAIPNWEEPLFQHAFFVLLGIIMTAKAPLSLEAIGAFVKPQSLPRNISIKVLLNPLGCLLDGLDGNNQVHTLHPSFHDFLTNQARSTNQYYIDKDEHGLKLAVSCLTLLNSQLRQNICELVDNTTANADIPDLEESIKTQISEALAYAAFYTFDHILDIVNPSPSVLNLLHEFLFHHLLEWIEALSLLGGLDVLNTSMLGEMDKWLQKSSHEEDVKMLRDAGRFLLAFRPLLESHALQVYSSALVFTPVETVLSQCYAPQALLNPTIVPIQSYWSPSLITLEGHTNYVTHVVFSPDGTKLASSSRDGTLQLWDACSGVPIGYPFIGHTHDVSTVKFSPDGTRLASCSTEGEIWLWDTKTGNPIGDALTGHEERVYLAIFSPDGNILASCSEDHTVRLWNAYNGNPIGDALIGHTDEVFYIVFSRDGTKLASCSWDKTVRLWDPSRGAAIGGPLICGAEVNTAAFSPNGTQLASGSDDGVIRFWDTKTGLELGNPLVGHTDWIMGVEFSPDGKRLASCSDDYTICLWDTENRVAIGAPLVGHTERIWRVTFSPDGTRLVSCSNDNTVRLWDAFNGQAIGILSGHTNRVTWVEYSQDGAQLASASDDNTIRVWDAKTRATAKDDLFPHISWISLVVFSPDGTKLVSCPGDNTLQLWDSKTGSLIDQVDTGHNDQILMVVFSPNGKQLASCSTDGTARLWDVQRRLIVGAALVGHSDWVSTVLFSPDGSRLASCSRDQTIRLWETQSGLAIGSALECNTNAPSRVVFSQDGKRLACYSWDNSVQLWDTSNGQLIEVSPHSVAPDLAQSPHYLSYIREGWLWIHGVCALWIPLEYRGYAVALHEQTIAIGGCSGKVLFIKWK